MPDKDIKLSVSDKALNYFAKEGYDPQYGARPLKRLIQNKVLTPIASLMIDKGRDLENLSINSPRFFLSPLQASHFFRLAFKT